MAALPALAATKSISAKQVLRALSVIRPLAGRMTPNVQFHNAKDQAWLVCGDDNLAARVLIDAPFDSGCGSAKNLARALRACQDEELQIEAGKEGLLLRTDRLRCSVRPDEDKVPCRQLPINERVEFEVRFSGRDFWAILDACASACSSDLHRPILTGIAIQGLAGGQVVAVATDTHRLHILSTEIESSALEGKTIVIPLSAWRTIERFDPDLDLDLTLTVFKDDLFEVSAEGFSVGGLLIRGTFPSWERVVPNKYTFAVAFEAGEVVRALRSVGEFAKGAANRVRFQSPGVEGDSTLYVKNEEFGEITRTVPVKAVAAYPEFALNYRYALEAIHALGGGVVEFRGTENTRPLTIESELYGGFKAVIQPMAVA